MSICLVDPSYKFKKDISEPHDIFIQRVRFVLLALDQNLPLKQCISLGYAYRNKLLYNTSYQSDVEKLIIKVINQNK